MSKDEDLSFKSDFHYNSVKNNATSQLAKLLNLPEDSALVVMIIKKLSR